MSRKPGNRYRHLLAPLALLCLSGFNAIALAQDTSQHIRIELGNNRISPSLIEVPANTPMAIELVNIDIIAPHTFTIEDKVGNLVINQNVEGGKTVTTELPTLNAGSYTFYCNKSLPLQKSHREQGEEGTLMVMDP